MKNISYNREKVEECYFEEQAVYVCDSETEYKEKLEAYRQKLDSKLYDVKPTLFEDIEMNIQELYESIVKLTPYKADQPDNYRKNLREALSEYQKLISQLDFASDDGSAVETAQRMAYMAQAMKYSVIIIASLPMLIAYPFVQKYFVKGMMIGSLKG